tara:strand:- start:1381 stop:3942 length:2562 start_codon:yes stop_codon:yes gene_type:complete
MMEYLPLQRRLEESVFGMAGNIGAEAATIVFVSLILGLVMLEIGFAKAEDWAKEHETNELFEKLKKELTMMGILSFTVFIYQTAYDNAENEYYMAFEMSHIVILFIAISFIIQASFLLQFAFKEGKHFLLAQRTTATDLLDMYNVMKKESAMATWFFTKSPFWVPAFPAFRNDIENKLIERLFLYKHKLPDEFRFAHYMSKLFSKYISELGEVSPISWVLLGLLVLLNMARIFSIDGTYETRLCPRGEGEDGDEEKDERKLFAAVFLPHLARKLHRRLMRSLSEEEGGDEEEEEFHPVCYTFLFEYAFVVIMQLGFIMVVVYMCSAYYHQAMLKALLEEEELEWDSDKGREIYLDVLQNMAYDEGEHQRSVSKDGGSPEKTWNRRASRRGSNIPSSITNNPVHHVNAHTDNTMGRDRPNNPLLVGEAVVDEVSKSLADRREGTEHEQELAVRGATGVSSPKKPTRRRSSAPYYNKKAMEVMKNEQQSILSETKREEDNEREMREMGLVKRVKTFFYTCFYGEQGGGHLDSLFLFSNPNLFFGAVEFTLLMQCLYIAMWATQLVPLLVQYENKSEAFGWGLGLTLPMLGNFLIIRLVLSRAVMLQAVCGVHPQVLGEVTEEAIEEDHCLERLRRAVRHRLEADVEAVRWEALAASGTPDAELPEQTSHEKVASYKVFLKRIFDTYDDDGSGAIGEREFVTMLNDLCVYFSRSSFKILWFAIDFDLSGEVSWDELFIIMFPELKAEMKRELAIVNKLREALGNKFNEMKLTSKDERLQYMKTVFEQYDADQSGTIDVHEMEDLVREYLPEMDTKGTEQLFAAIDTDGEGGIEWSEFSDIFFGIAEQQEKKTLKWF